MRARLIFPLLVLPGLLGAGAPGAFAQSGVPARPGGAAANPDSSGTDQSGTGRVRPGSAPAGSESGLRRDVEIWLDALRPRGPDAPPAGDILRLLQAHPLWPARATLTLRLGQALDDTAPAAAATLCRGMPAADAALDASLALPCARAALASGDAKTAHALAARAWREAASSSQEAAEILRTLLPDPAASDSEARLQRLAWAGNAALVAELLPRLQGDAAQAARAWAALRRDDQAAEALLAAITPGSPWREAGWLRLEEARAARREGALHSAKALWDGPVAAAETASPGRAASFAAERDALARALLEDHDPKPALALTEAPDLPAAQRSDLLALRGVIAWDQGDLDTAAAAFTQMAGLAPGIVTQARASYWQGRVAARRGDSAAAARAYAQAARYPTNFYGQAAILAMDAADALPARLAATRDPVPSAAENGQVQGNELVAAAAILADLDEPHYASIFLQKAAEAADSPGVFAALGLRARALGLAEAAVQIARLAGKQGVLLAQTGWPAPYRPPPDSVPEALALGVMRQESSFDPAVMSGAGAVGLMQLLPSTAAELARGSANAMMLSDPAANMALGTAYLAQLITRFGGCVPYAVAAYNAGPKRLTDWIGPGASPPADMAALAVWIEHIPFAETRAYVPRVLESALVYNRGRPLPLGLKG